MTIVKVLLDHIDFNDTLYRIPSAPYSSRLFDSIADTGLINLPTLVKHGEGYRILLGWKRLAVCKELGLKDEVCRVYDPEELTATEVIKLIYLDNEHRFTDLERALLFSKFKELSGLNDRELTTTVLPLLGVSPSGKNLERMTKLAGLDQEVIDATLEERITVEQANLLANIEDISERQYLLKEVLIKYGLNNNEARETVYELLELAAIKGVSTKEIVEAAIAGVANKQIFRERVKSLRYPEYSSVVDEFQKIRKEMGLPESVNIAHDRYFERDDLQIRFKINSSDDLDRVITSLKNANDTGSIRKLLELIKKGRG